MKEIKNDSFLQFRNIRFHARRTNEGMIRECLPTKTTKRRKKRTVQQSLMVSTQWDSRACEHTCPTDACARVHELSFTRHSRVFLARTPTNKVCYHCGERRRVARSRPRTACTHERELCPARDVKLLAIS